MQASARFWLDQAKVDPEDQVRAEVSKPWLLLRWKEFPKLLKQHALQIWSRHQRNQKKHMQELSLFKPRVKADPQAGFVRTTFAAWDKSAQL